LEENGTAFLKGESDEKRWASAPVRTGVVYANAETWAPKYDKDKTKKGKQMGGTQRKKRLYYGRR
jgi:hypothetical protein